MGGFFFFGAAAMGRSGSGVGDDYIGNKADGCLTKGFLLGTKGLPFGNKRGFFWEQKASFWGSAMRST